MQRTYNITIPITFQMTSTKEPHEIVNEICTELQSEDSDQYLSAILFEADTAIDWGVNPNGVKAELKV